MIKKKIVTIDFDGTLSRSDVQTYVRTLMLRDDVEVYILTARYDELHKHLWASNPSNEDLYLITDNLSIPRDRIIFMNFEPKYKYLHNTKVLWHLDDSFAELDFIQFRTKVTPVNVTTEGWRYRCQLLLDARLHGADL